MGCFSEALQTDQKSIYRYNTPEAFRYMGTYTRQDTPTWCRRMLIFILLITVSDAAKPTFSVSPETFVDGAEVTVKCDSDDFDQTIQFKLGSVSKGGCSGPSSCGTGVAGYKPPEQANNFTTTMVIEAYNSSRDEGSWTCSHGGIPSDPFLLRATISVIDVDAKSCNETRIFVLFFIVALICMAATFFLVIWLRLRFPRIGKVVIIIVEVLIDVVLEIFLLWVLEYYVCDFQMFRSDNDCNVLKIGLVCHGVAGVIEILKVVVQYKYITDLGDHIFGCCPSCYRRSNMEEHSHLNLLPPVNGGGRVGPSVMDRNGTVPKTADVTLLMYFNVPEGYVIDKWVNEENSPLDDKNRYVSNVRGSLLIKSATESDNGIYQCILTCNGSEQRVNVVLHVTGKEMSNLIVNPLVWRRLKTRKFEKASDLKKMRYKVATNDIDDNPIKDEKDSNECINSIRWEHNGKMTQNSGTSLIVTNKQPTDEYLCTVQFTNRKSHLYFFIVKFTGVSSGKIDDVVGVPTTLSTKRITTSSLAPLRHTATTAQGRQTSDRLPIDENNLDPVTERSAQST